MDRYRTLLILLAAQTGCVASGFWVHSRFCESAWRHGSTALSGPEAYSALQTAGLIGLLWTLTILALVAYLIISRLYDRIDQERAAAEASQLALTESMARLRDAMIFGLAKLTESRDPETGGHLERISMYCSYLAQAMRRQPRFRDAINSDFVQTIEVSSILHDIGKVGIEDEILLKPGPLTKSERQRMQQHTTIGAGCIQDIEQRLGSSNFLQMAREIAASHHERWDGQGYPRRLNGEQIPLSARIVSVVDVYEALSSPRVYKPALPHEQCIAYIRGQAGKQFDPYVVECFLSIETQIREIARHFATLYALEDSTAVETEVKEGSATSRSSAAPSEPPRAATSETVT